MHPSSPAPEPLRFSHPTFDPHGRILGKAQQSADNAAAAAESLIVAEEVEEPERWDGLS
jgi:hypothetical protein